MYGYILVINVSCGYSSRWVTFPPFKMADLAQKCEHCNETFNNASAYSRHKQSKVCKNIGSKARFKCTFCKRKFTRKDNMLRHVKYAHTRYTVPDSESKGGGAHRQHVFLCGLCDKTFVSRETVVKHRNKMHPIRTKFRTVASAHKRACMILRLDLPDSIRLITECLEYAIPKARRLIRHLLVEKKSFKASFSLALRFRKHEFAGGQDEDEDEEVNTDPHGREGVDVITHHIRSHSTSFRFMDGRRETQMSDMLATMLNTFDDFLKNGSGWVLVDCLHFDVSVAECAPLVAGGEGDGCGSHVVTYRKDTGFCYENIESEDSETQRCFYHAIAMYFHQQTQEGEKKHQLPTCNELESLLREIGVVENVPSPVGVKDITKFEEGNRHLDLAVNVMFRDENGDIYPTRASKFISAKNTINLFIFFTKQAFGAGMSEEDGDYLDMSEDEEGDDDITVMMRNGKTLLHYAWCDSMKQVLARRKQTANGDWYQSPCHLCFNCFTVFTRETALEAHVLWCHKEKGQRYVLPEPRTSVSYEKKQKEFKIGYTFFFDFETLQKKSEQKCSCKPEKMHRCKHKTEIVTEHIPFAYSFLLLDREGVVLEDEHYIGEDADIDFIHLLARMEEKYITKLKEVEPLVMSEEEEEEFLSADTCHICKKDLYSNRVRDHCHITGKYVGAAHNLCNLHRRECMKLVGFAHNLSGYDSHIILQALAKEGTGSFDAVDCIPLNTEKFKMLKLGNCVLLDSMAFLNDSLERLVDNLRMSDHDFDIVKQGFTDPKLREMILRKGVYPYEYVTHLERVTRIRSCLPKRKHFFSSLSGKHVDESDYKHALKVWDAFECESISDYTAVYVRADTYQLAEAIFELRQSIYKDFQVDMCHYLSLPMLTKDLMMRSTGVEMELMHDIDMINMVKRSIRGGLSFVNTRHFSVAGESEKRASMLADNPDVSVVYVDANNLYGAAMSHPMPLKDFAWMTEEELCNFSPENDVNMYAEGRGYILEVTLTYPKKLHRKHSSFPLAPHQLEINESHLSPFAKEALSETSGKSAYKATKLTSTFLPRVKYVCHGANLQLYLRLGMKLEKIHRGISFYQKSFIKPYIEMCTKRRAESKTKTRSTMWKGLSNSLFGKVCLFSSVRLHTMHVLYCILCTTSHSSLFR